MLPEEEVEKKMHWNRIRVAAVPYLFLAPFFLLFFIFLVYPLVYAFSLSLYKETLVGGTRFVGADNYLRVFGDDRFWTGVGNTLRYGIFLVPTLLALSLAVALLLDSKVPKATSFFRIAFFVPYAVPGVIAALIWGYLYGPTFGPIAQSFRGLGLPPPPILSERWMLFAIANIVIWELLGYKMIIAYSAMKTIPPELEEAANLDGASGWQYAWHVKIPLVTGAIMLNAIFSIIGTLQLFNEPSIMKKIAPEVINDAYTPNLYAYSLAFTAQDLGYAAAVSFVLAFLVAVISSAVLLISNRKSRKR
jgi:multiple sugar transport system permease protein